MSIFGDIMTKIFRHPKAQPAPAALQPQPAAAAAPASQPPPQVDVAAVLDAMTQDSPETLDWRRSIVDLMKLLSLDSSFAARKQLAGELRYTGDTGDSASMNIWLHKQVMTKLAENGGMVPDSLR